MTRWLLTFADTAAALDVPDTTDELCCVFAHDWAVRYYGAERVARAPKSAWMCWAESKDPWGPVTACVQAGLNDGAAQQGAPDAVKLTVGRMHRVQGWRGAPFAAGVTGHTVTVFAADGGRVLVFDSAKDRNERVTSTTWSAYAKQFTGGVAVVVLRDVL